MVANLVLPRRVSGAVKRVFCDRKMIQFMPANHSNTKSCYHHSNHSDKTLFQKRFRYVATPRC